MRPDWLDVHSRVVSHPKHSRHERPHGDAIPDRQEWQIAATVTLDDEAVTREARRKASFLVATKVLAPE